MFTNRGAPKNSLETTALENSRKPMEAVGKQRLATFKKCGVPIKFIGNSDETKRSSDENSILLSVSLGSIEAPRLACARRRGTCTTFGGHRFDPNTPVPKLGETQSKAKKVLISIITSTIESRPRDASQLVATPGSVAELTR